MATQLQTKLAEEIVKNAKRKVPLNKKELVVLSGYDLTTAEKQVPRVFEQKGVREELERLGFTESNAKKVVAEILLNPETDPNTRIRAASEVFKVEGSYAPEKTQNLNINASLADLDNERLERIAQGGEG